MVLVANSPQLLLSFLYFAYNGLWTCMLLAKEWTGYARERKPLRVTSPVGRQRSTYRLQLPYRYGIPLLILSGFLHWLVSQSIFLVDLEAYYPDGTPDTYPAASIVACGYSPITILTAIIVGTIVLLLGLASGFRRYKQSSISFAGSCSAAISAACHPPLGDNRASGKAVMWGACGGEEDGDWGKDMSVVEVERLTGGDVEVGGQGVDKVRVGHCSFTSFAVEEPVVGGLYS